MKLLSKITVALALFLFVMVGVSKEINAQTFRPGIKGGLNYSNAKLNDVDFSKLSSTYSGFNIGLMLNIELWMGFSIQPEILFTQTGFQLDNASVLTPVLQNPDLAFIKGNVEIPINFQWGITFDNARIYAQVSPYYGYSLSNKFTAGVVSIDVSKQVERTQFGMGIGFGVEFWQLQFAYRYKWDLNSVGNNFSEISGDIGSLVSTEDSKIRGSELSIGLFF